MNWTEKELQDYLTRINAPPKENPNPHPEPVKIPKSRMNSWETQYAQYLDMLKFAREIQWYGFEAIKLRLATGAYYKPDFAIATKNGELCFVEVKGHWREAALVRFKVACDLFPFRFTAVRKAENGEWETIKEAGLNYCK